MAESKELVEARRSLAAAEARLGAAESLVSLRRGIALLRDVIEEGSGAAATTAQNVAAAYAKRIYERIAAQTAADAQLPEPELEHYFSLVLAFDAIGAALPKSAARLKIDVVRALIERYCEGHPPEKKREALEQLAQLGRSL
jgi:hypothetical protein